VRKNLIVLLVMFCVSFSGVAVATAAENAETSPQLQLRKALVGTWHTKFVQSDGGYREEYFTVSENGTFRLRFLTTNRLGRLVDAYAIVGIWGVAQDIFFTSNLRYEYHNDVQYPAYLGDAHEFNAYKIVEITESFQRYQVLGGSAVIKLSKVTEDPCTSVRGIKVACGSQDRILVPSGSNSGSAISLAE